jgi:hypothetical protein
VNDCPCCRRTRWPASILPRVAAAALATANVGIWRVSYADQSHQVDRPWRFSGPIRGALLS